VLIPRVRATPVEQLGTMLPMGSRDPLSLLHVCLCLGAAIREVCRLCAIRSELLREAQD
jgi:hypothetical protein